MGYSSFYLYRGMDDVKIQGVPQFWFFPGISISKYIFPWGKFAEFTFFGVADSKILSGIIFFRGTELPKIKFQGIYKSNSHSFKGVLVFKNLVFHTPVWIKNGIAQWPSKLSMTKRTESIKCKAQSLASGH